MAKDSKRLGRGLGGLISSGIGADAEVPAKAKTTVKSKKTGSRVKGKGRESKGKDETAQQTGGEALIDVPIGKVRPNRYQPRKRIDAHQIKELAASIKSEGLIQPIAVDTCLR